MTKDNRWIEVLSGRRKSNKKNPEEIEAAHLREAIHNYEKDIGLDKISPENSYFRFKQVKDSKKSEVNEQEKNKFYYRFLSYANKKIQAIKLFFVFILGVCASLFIPLLTINAPMQVASNDHNSIPSSSFEQASKENKNGLVAIGELRNINPTFNLLASHVNISVSDYLELNKLHSIEAEDYINKYILLALNNFLDYGDLLKSQHKKPLLCLAEEKIYKADKLREIIDLEINGNKKVDLNKKIEVILLLGLIKENPCN